MNDLSHALNTFKVLNKALLRVVDIFVCSGQQSTYERHKGIFLDVTLA